jgi:hypothetical protein
VFRGRQSPVVPKKDIPVEPPAPIKDSEMPVHIHIHIGDEVHGDKIAGDKVGRDKKIVKDGVNTGEM